MTGIYLRNFSFDAIKLGIVHLLNAEICFETRMINNITFAIHFKIDSHTNALDVILGSIRGDEYICGHLHFSCVEVRDFSYVI